MRSLPSAGVVHVGRLWRRRAVSAVSVAVLAAMIGREAGVDPARAEPLGLDQTAIQRVLAPLGIAPDELGIRDLNFAADPWRLRVVDHLLARPLEAVGVVRGMAAELRAARHSLLGLVAIAAPYLDLPLPPAAEAIPEDRTTLAGVLSALHVAGLAASAVDPEPRLRRVPVPVQTVVADLLRAMARAAPIIREASARLAADDRAFLVRTLSKTESAAATLDETDAWRVLDLAARVDRGRLFTGAMMVCGAVDRARRALAQWVREGKPGLADGAAPSDRPDVADGDVLLVAETSLGLVVIGGPGSTTYRQDAALIVDLGGDDSYLNRAGGTADPAHPIAIVIDLDGDDRYVAPGDFAHGAAAFGVGILLDLAGRDTYVGRQFAQGAGLFGVGILVDAAGDDVYEAAAFAQGAAGFGLGLLVDETGNDRYQATLFAQGFGMTAGLGLLLEETGNDSYVIAGGPRDFRQPEHGQSFGQGFGLGMRPLASGGIGLLADHAGSDLYVADYFAQGASYWLGLGALVDDAGDDRYVATRYAQGAGVHLSVGVLWDGSGDDAYSAWGVSQGCGHDFAVGILADGGGHDLYVATWLSQGVGNADGIGLLVDLGGDDRYVASGADVQGHGRAARRAQSLGFLLDLGGKDSYAGQRRDGQQWDGFEHGGGLDADGIALGFDLGPRGQPMSTVTATAFGRGAPSGYPRPADPSFSPRDEVGRTVHERLRRAMEPLETPENTRARDEARRALRAMGREAVPALVDLLESSRVGAVLEVFDALVALGEAAHPALYVRLRDPNWLVRRRAARLLAETATPDAARVLAASAGADPDPVVRASAAEAIGRARPEGAPLTLAGLLARDPESEVRATSALALGRFTDEVAIRALTQSLADPAFFVRLAARTALAAIRSAPPAK